MSNCYSQNSHDAVIGLDLTKIPQHLVPAVENIKRQSRETLIMKINKLIDEDEGGVEDEPMILGSQPEPDMPDNQDCSYYAKITKPAHKDHYVLNVSNPM